MSETTTATAATHPTSRRERNLASMKAHRERKRQRAKEVGMRPVAPNPPETDEQMAEQPPRRCRCCKQMFTPLRPQQSFCLSPCTPLMLIQKEQEERGKAVMSRLQRSLTERVC